MTPSKTHLTVLENQTLLPHGVTLSSWFCLNEGTIARVETYQIEDGSVVAYQETINGVSELLHMDSAFKTLHKEEDDFATILKYAGVLDPDKIPVFYTGGTV